MIHNEKTHAVETSQIDDGMKARKKEKTSIWNWAESEENRAENYRMNANGCDNQKETTTNLKMAKNAKEKVHCLSI